MQGGWNWTQLGRDDITMRSQGCTDGLEPTKFKRTKQIPLLSAPANFKTIKRIYIKRNLTLWKVSDFSAFSRAPPIVSHRTLPGAHMSKFVSICCVYLEFQPSSSFASVLQSVLFQGPCGRLFWSRLGSCRNCRNVETKQGLQTCKQGAVFHLEAMKSPQLKPVPTCRNDRQWNRCPTWKWECSHLLFAPLCKIPQTSHQYRTNLGQSHFYLCKVAWEFLTCKCLENHSTVTCVLKILSTDMPRSFARASPMASAMAASTSPSQPSKLKHPNLRCHCEFTVSDCGFVDVKAKYCGKSYPDNRKEHE